MDNLLAPSLSRRFFIIVIVNTLSIIQTISYNLASPTHTGRYLKPLESLSRSRAFSEKQVSMIKK